MTGVRPILPTSFTNRHIRLNSAEVRALDVLSLEEQSLRADLPQEKCETIHAILHFDKFTLVELPR